MAIVSSNPAVVTNATRAPFRSSIAFVPTVVPCLNSNPSPAARNNPTPSITARPGSPGVDRTFTTRISPPTIATQSVNVPPVSIAIRKASRTIPLRKPIPTSMLEPTAPSFYLSAIPYPLPLCPG